MLDISLHQGSSLHCHAPEVELRLASVVSQGTGGRTLETLWQVCSHLQRLGYPVIVLDGTAQESDQAPGLQHLLVNAPWNDSAFSTGGTDTFSLAVLPAFQGLCTLAFDMPHLSQPLQALQPLFRRYALVVVYASVGTLSSPLLTGTATAPLLLMEPGRLGVVASYKQLKHLAVHRGLAGTVACVAEFNDPAHLRQIHSQLKTLRQCAARHLGQHIGTTTVYAHNTQDMQRLALQLLENAGTIGAPAYATPSPRRSLAQSYALFSQRH
ncbi:MAG: hypothetical protein PHU77_13750 [Simplicispira sp.]|nr:hypothetical protein [Simplicispira sp.]